MNAQLDQILNYLDREGVTEIVIAVGRTIAMRKAGAYSTLTSKPVSATQLSSLIQGTPLPGLIPSADSTLEAVEVDLGKRRVRVQAGRRGEEIVFRIERSIEPHRHPAMVPSVGEPRTSTLPAVAAPPKRAPTPPPIDLGPGFSLELEATPKPGPAPAPAKPAGAPPKSRMPQPFALDLDDATGPALELETRPSAKPGGAAKPVAPAPPTPAPTQAPTPAPAQALPRRSGPPVFADLVRVARERGASDLHVAGNLVMSVRVAGELVALEASPLSTADADACLLPLLGPEHKATLEDRGYVDLAVDAPGGGRLRANIARHQGGLKGTFRLAASQPSTLDQLGLPKELAKVVAHHQGLVVIAGPSGHGKTTTLAALVDLVNSSRAHHILTIEDPVEIVHPRKMAVVSQREAGRHTMTFASGLKASLREDPDVIVIGELRDRETVEIALTASETGHLVLSTMSTPSAAKTIDRLIDMFPPEDQNQVRASIAGALRAVLAQRLLPGVDGGVVPVVELVTGVLPLAAMIRDDKLFQLPNLMQRGKSFGMIRFDDSLAEHVRAGRIREEVALAAADSKKELTNVLHPPAPTPGKK